MSILNLNSVKNLLRPKPKQIAKIPVASDIHSVDRALETLAQLYENSKDPKAKKTSESQTMTKRVDFEKLELAYQLDEITFRCVNFYALQIAGPGFDIIGDAKAVKVIENFMTKTQLRLKIEEIVRDMCITGNSFWEEIKNATGNIIDVQRIDYKKIDYVRKNGYVKEDDAGLPVGYKFVSTFGKAVYFTDGKDENGHKDDILHFKLFNMGNELAIGFVEPAIRLIHLKLNIRHGFAEAGYRAGHPLYVIYVGDKPDPKSGWKGIMPNESMISTINSEWQDIEQKSKFVMPWFTKVEELKPPTSEVQSDILSYCDSRIAATFGLPLSIAVGEGKTSREMIEVSVTRDVDRRIKSIQNKIALELENGLFKQILKQNGIENAEVKIRWREITPPDLNRKAKRITEYISSGILKPEDVKEMVMKEENISPVAIKKAKALLADIGRKHITIEEAVAFLQNLKISFPDSGINNLLNKLIELLLMKSTKPEKPKEEEATYD